MKLRSAALTMALTAGVISGACGPTSPNPSGTGGSSGGTAGTGGSGPSCPSVTACGGDVVGTWNVTSSCLTLSSSNLDIGAAGLDPSACKNVTLSGSLTVTGTWTANANGTYTDGTTTTGNVQIGPERY